MFFSFRDNRKKNIRRIVGIFVALILLIFIITRQQIAFDNYFFSKIAYFFDSLRSRFVGADRQTHEQFQNRIAGLEQEISLLRSRFAEQSYNARLDQFLTEHNYRTMRATVLLKDTAEGYYSIDKGRADGVQEGYAVIRENGGLVGRIKYVKDTSSYMAPYESVYFSAIVDFVGNRTSTVESFFGSGIARSSFSKTIEVNSILPDASVTEGDMAVTSNLNDTMPFNIAVGRVKQVEQHEGSFFKTAIIEPSASLENLRTVAIVLPLGKEE